MRLEQITYTPNPLSHHNEYIQQWITQGITIDRIHYFIEEYFIENNVLFAIISVDKRTFYKYAIAGLGGGNTEDLKKRITELENRKDNYVSDVVVSREGNIVKLTYTRVDGTSSEVSFEDNGTVALAYDDTAIVKRLNALETKEDNDKQTLSLDGNVLSISNGNSVTLPSVSSQPSQPPHTNVINVTPTFNKDSITFDTQGFVKGFEYTLGCNATVHAKGQENIIDKSYKVGTHLHTLVDSSSILVHYGSEHTVEVVTYFDGNNTLNYVLKVTYLNEVFTKVFTKNGDNALVAEITVDSHELKNLSCNVTLSLSEIRGEG